MASKPEIKVIGEERFARVSNTNGWFECTPEGKPFYDRGEVETAEHFAKAFPDFEVRVTIGPYRLHDIAYELDAKAKLIKVDLYSVRAGLQYIEQCIEEIKAKLAQLKENV